MRTSIIIIKVFLIGALLIAANLNLNINNPSDRGILYNQIFGWLDNVYQESLGFAGYVVKSEWLPDTAEEISRNNTE